MIIYKYRGDNLRRQITRDEITTTFVKKQVLLARLVISDAASQKLRLAVEIQNGSK